jgi:dipeptidyl aminopeptidase/acylaminoacyl peptidase
MSRLVPITMLVAASGAALVLGAAGYVATTAYNRLSSTLPRCGSSGTDIHEPTSFVASVFVDGVARAVDTTPYRMPPPMTVSFPARDDPAITIAGWWEPAAQPDAPAVIVTHGLNGCRRNAGNLLVAGMLHRHGFAVLLLDMREHGDSTVEDGRWAGGTAEYRDVLGGYDWLRARGLPAERIGLFGFSGGAITSMIAMGEEPAIPAIWADSSWTSAGETIRDGLTANGVPTFLDQAVLLLARLHGADLTAKSPLAATAAFGGRHAFIAHGERDRDLSPRYLATLAEGIRTAGGTVETWLAPASGHTQAHLLYPAEYEARLVDFFARVLGSPGGSPGGVPADGS